MKIGTSFLTGALGLALLLSTTAPAAFTVHQQAAPAPTYSTTLNFDEPGTPTGNVPSTFWLASKGVTIGTGTDVNNVGIADMTGTFPWVGTGNSAQGSFGLYLDFTQNITSISFQAWGSAGAPGPFGGGIQIFILDDVGNIIDGDAFTPAWNGNGNTWYNITTTGGSSFRHLYVNNNSNVGNPGYIDNVSWNVVPAPGCLAFLAVGGMFGRARRRR